MLQFKPFSQHQVQLYQVPYPTPQSEGFSLFCSVLVNIPTFHHYSYHQQIISSILQMRTVTNIRKTNHSHIVINTALSMEPGNFQASSRALLTLTSCLSPPPFCASMLAGCCLLPQWPWSIREEADRWDTMASTLCISPLSSY